MSDAPALAAGLTTVVLWGSAFVAIRAAGETLSPGAIALGRLLVSSLVLGLVALARRERLPARGDLLRIAVYGVLWLGVYSIALSAAERRVDAGTAAMIVNTGPILIAVLAGFFLHEGFPRGLFAGCAVAFGGCLLIGLATVDSDRSAGFALVLLTIAALAYASSVVVQKTALLRASPFAVTWLGCAAATVACLPFAPQLVRGLAGSGGSAAAWTVYLGLGPTALGFAMWSFALGRESAGRTASLNYLIPVVALVLGWAVLAERPAWLAVGGGTLCLAGVAVARHRPGARITPWSR